MVSVHSNKTKTGIQLVKVLRKRGIWTLGPKQYITFTPFKNQNIMEEGVEKM